MEPRIIVTAGAVIRDKAGRILLQKRSDYGDWGLPGGAMEPGETVEETMLREVREETGLLLEAYRFVGVYSGPRMHYQYPDGNRVVFVMFLFESMIEDTADLHTVDSQGETLDLKFFRLPEINMELINRVQKPVLDDIMQCNEAILRG